MAEKQWFVSKVCYCEHVGHEIALETELILPSDYMPEQPPRIHARRCSNAIGRKPSDCSRREAEDG